LSAAFADKKNKKQPKQVEGS